jgi:GNAT superfamily N-acetyltransferase
MSWFESYRKGGFSPDIGYDLFRPGMDNRIDRLLPRSRVIVASPTAVPDEVCGYIVDEGPVTHYLYVKQDYRRLGLATALLQLAGKPSLYTHETRAGRILAAKHQIRFNPFFIESTP